MTEPVEPPDPAIEQQLQTLDERVVDLARVIARQAASIDLLVDAGKARGRETSSADVPLLVDLFALYLDAETCARSAAEGDRAAFAALAAGLDRLITGRGGRIVTPAVGADFDARAMEAIEVVRGPEVSADQDRTVAEVVRPGLVAGDRSLRPAAVTVFRG